MKLCKAHKLGDKAAVVRVTVSAFPGCRCYWCIRAESWPSGMIPGCGCNVCACHPAHNQPEHFARVCERHGVRWTIDATEPDACRECRLETIERKGAAMLYELRARIAWEATP